MKPIKNKGSGTRAALFTVVGVAFLVAAYSIVSLNQGGDGSLPVALPQGSVSQPDRATEETQPETLLASAHSEPDLTILSPPESATYQFNLHYDGWVNVSALYGLGSVSSMEGQMVLSESISGQLSMTFYKGEGDKNWFVFIQPEHLEFGADNAVFRGPHSLRNTSTLFTSG